MIRTRAFSLIEVLIAIVVLAIGLLGIASVFPAVVTQQKSTTFAVQGASYAKSVEAILKSHYGMSRQSYAQDDPADVNTFGIVLRDDLRGWASLTGLFQWSPPVREYGYSGVWDLPATNARPPGMLLNLTNGLVTVMGTINNPRLGPQSPEYPNDRGYVTPGFRLTEEARLIGHRPTLPDDRAVRGEYIYDFAARRIGAGRAFRENGSESEQYRTCQDDHIELAVFIRAVDRPGSVPGDGVAVGEDAQGRPTFNGTGSYSRIRQATFTVPTQPQERETATQLITLTGNIDAVRAMRQLNQKFVSPFGTTHTVVGFGDGAADVWIKPELDAKKLQPYPNADRMFLYTPQIPVGVSVVRIAPKIVRP